MSPPSTDPRERASRRAHGHQQWEHGCRTEEQVLLMTFDLSTFNSSVQPLGLPVTYYSIKTTFCIKWLLICPPKWHLSVDKKTNIWYIIYFKCIFFEHTWPLSYSYLFGLFWMIVQINEPPLCWMARGAGAAFIHESTLIFCVLTKTDHLCDCSLDWWYTAVIAPSMTVVATLWSLTPVPDTLLTHGHVWYWSHNWPCSRSTQPASHTAALSTLLPNYGRTHNNGRLRKWKCVLIVSE